MASDQVKGSEEMAEATARLKEKKRGRLERSYESIRKRTLAEEGSLCDGLLEDKGEGGEEAGVVIRDDLFSDIAIVKGAKQTRSEGERKVLALAALQPTASKVHTR